jgi:hypothetical protein
MLVAPQFKFERLAQAHGSLHCSVAIYFMYYNFCRIRKTLRITPAMQAGLTDHVWSLEELATPKKRITLKS